MDVLHWSRHHRLFPGQGAFDLATFTGHVLAAGYRGPLSLEVFNDVFRQADPRPAAVDAMRSLVALRESVGALAVPEAPRLDGHAFAELAVPATVLAELGFTQVGTHRSKPVRLWQQGSARLLVNEAAAAGTISALGLTSANPAGSARRAEDLLAPVLPREHGPGEADLSAVAAPDGTEIFFCGNEEWLRDFVPTGALPAGVGITGIDHVALTQPFDHFDEATLFYRSVLGLRPEPVSEFAAPFGLVRSRAVGNRDVRLTLDSALVRRGEWAPGVPSPQHIALVCEDAIAVARAMREAGAPLLSIPGNYYDDLDARFDLPFSAALRENSVLYDRDSSGEFLHFCTELVGSRVFFEVVQRIGGYRGYGVVNTPVYMTAHRERRLSLAR